jgi:hypothetical protein
VAGDSDKPPSGARRVAQVVHDDLGNARVEWRKIPDDRTGNFARPTFTIEGEGPDMGADPYDRTVPSGRRDSHGTGTTRRDLRKLSEWIKLKREMEERKQRGEDDE